MDDFPPVLCAPSPGPAEVPKGVTECEFLGLSFSLTAPISDLGKLMRCHRIEIAESFPELCAMNRIP